MCKPLARAKLRHIVIFKIFYAMFRYYFVVAHELKIKVESLIDLTKGSRKNNLAELALRFGSGLADPREQNHRNSELFRGFCE